MKSTKIMIILHSIIAFLFIFLFVNTAEYPIKGSLFFLTYIAPLTPIFVCGIIEIIEKKRVNIADKTEKKAFFIAKILSNILFLIFYFCFVFVWFFWAVDWIPRVD